MISQKLKHHICKKNCENLSLSLVCVCSAFSGRSRPPMTPVFSIMSSFSLCVHSTSLLFIQSIIISLCLPRVHVLFILPSKTVRRRDSLLNTWPNQFFCLCRMVFIKLLFSSTMSKTCSLDRCSVQLIFSNLFQIHISGDSMTLNVHVPQRLCFCVIQYVIRNTPNTQTVALVPLCDRLSWSSFSFLQFYILS